MAITFITVDEKEISVGKVAAVHEPSQMLTTA